jgi:hypothetical protein
VWTVISYALIVGTCVSSAIVAWRYARIAVVARESVLKRLRSCESKAQLAASAATELTELVDSVVQSQKMARVRKGTKHATGSHGEPDPLTDPEGWRNWKNAQIRAQGRTQ